MTSDVVYRPATIDDLPRIDGIEGGAFGNPWPADAYAQELERPGCSVSVAVAPSTGVVAYTCVWHVIDEAQLLRIAVDPDFRCRGVGRRMLKAVIARAHAAGCTRVVLDVAAGNDPARRLYESEGFVVIGGREAYYKAPPDDAVVMQWSASTLAVYGQTTSG